MIFYLLFYYFEAKLFSIMPESWVRKRQLIKFRKTFEWARENSPFYRELYKKAGILKLKIKNFEDVKKVPTVTKEMILEHKKEYILTTKLTNKLVHTSSSGSTGKPFDVYWTRKEYFKSYVRTFLALPFYNPLQSFVFIGLFKQKEEIERASFIAFCQQYLKLFQRENYSVITPFNTIVNSLKDRRIGILSSTNSCLYLLVEELKKQGLKLNVKYVVVSGETLADDLRTDLKIYLNSKVIDVYGCTELTSMAWSIADTTIYNYALNSVLPEYINSKQVNGETYADFVFTNFVNRTMPFIRYKVGDHVVPPGNSKQMGKISGRADDIMELNNGRRVFMYQLYIFFNPIGGFVQYKFLQKKDKTIVFQAICKIGVDKQKLEQKLIKTWSENYGNHPFKVEFKNELPINKYSGKFKRVEVEKNDYCPV
ncbi:hypothetical protein [uncultured Draconibacterium sp.]|uniref:hypothetical protein n=1 Tax=uncultured Draconibacterium sp. TaxID=1573823 RepID=UPI0037497F86